MAKRGAMKQLTDSNWDEEDEPEEAGIFTVANEEVIKGRQIKKAKRKGVAGEGSAATGAFKGFAGFTGLSSKPESSAPAFSFGGKTLSGFANGGSTSTSTAGAGLFSFSSDKKTTDTKVDPVTSSTDTKDNKVTNGSATSPSKSNYLSKLRSLNLGVSKWIKEHVDKNPHCILTPIFKDYEQYLADIEKLNPDVAGSKEKGDSKAAAEKKPPSSETSIFEGAKPSAPKTSIFGGSTETKTSSSGGLEVPKDTGGFTFGQVTSSTSTTTTTSTTSGFTFGQTSSGTSLFGSGTTGFSFATGAKDTESKPFSFASSVAAASKEGSTGKGEEEEEYVPPKPDVTEVQEDDALYTKRCKLFYQKDGAWLERGVGNLHLKPCSGKTQFLLRADTSLGNIIMNIMLNKSIPMKRQGKNNVSMICVPNPPIEGIKDEKKPVSMLIRVKTAEDADELLENLDKYKDGPDTD